MQLHQVKRDNKNKTKKRIGRGGKRGDYAGRGMKGQNQHSSGHIRPALRDIIKKIPKKRGFGINRSRTVNSSVVKPVIVNIGVIDKVFKEGEIVSPKTLKVNKLIHTAKGSKSIVKILGMGKVSKKLTISNCLVSDTAKTAIESKGGTIN